MNHSQKGTSLDQLYKFLRQFALSDGLLLISRLTNACKYSFDDVASEAHPEARTWIQLQCRSRVRRLDLMLQLTRLARFLLLSGANDHRAKRFMLNDRDFSYALTLVSRLHDRDIEGEINSLADLARAFGRLSQWQFALQADRRALIGRGYLFFVKLPGQLHGLNYDIENRMKEYFGLTALEFISSGFAAWIMSNGQFRHRFAVEVEPMKKIVSSDTLERFFRLSSGTPEFYRRSVRCTAENQDWKTVNKLLDVYALDPFYLMPAISVKTSRVLSPGDYIVPQPQYLLHRASLGIFHLLSDKEKELGAFHGSRNRNDFRLAFGEIYREYVRRHFLQIKSPGIMIDLDESIDHHIKRPDFALICNQLCILFEVKTTFLTLTSRIMYDSATAQKDIEDPNGTFSKGLKQLNAFEKSIQNQQTGYPAFNGVRNIVKVLVGFEDVHLANPFLLPLAKRIYGECAHNLQIVTSADIELIGTGLAHGGRMIEEIVAKVTSPDFNEWPLNSYLEDRIVETAEPNPLHKEAFMEFMRVIGGPYIEKWDYKL